MNPAFWWGFSLCLSIVDLLRESWLLRFFLNAQGINLGKRSDKMFATDFDECVRFRVSRIQKR